VIRPRNVALIYPVHVLLHSPKANFVSNPVVSEMFCCSMPTRNADEQSRLARPMKLRYRSSYNTVGVSTRTMDSELGAQIYFCLHIGSGAKIF
jgi:hypothetical protein